MSKLKSKYLKNFFTENDLRRRELGFKCSLGWEDALKSSIYSSLKPVEWFSPIVDSKVNVFQGGIFNLEFSPDGKHLVAACENQALMIFDPLTRKLVCDVPKAHSGCVNGIRFLDNRLFATCSDDKTVALWDVRNVRKRITRLQGHSHWVKNIEYSPEDGMLVTSGFDGRILGWNINRYNENKSNYVELFNMKGLMRIRLTPDLSKLMICTTTGSILVIHDLDLRHLARDLADFRPVMYRLMQLSSSFVNEFPKFKKLFSAPRNRVELIEDFPVLNDAEIIHSLQVHPQGWCVLSRNTSRGDTSEWTCVHDIQHPPQIIDEDDDTRKIDNRSSTLISDHPSSTSSRTSHSQLPHLFNLRRRRRNIPPTQREVEERAIQVVLGLSPNGVVTSSNSMSPNTIEGEAQGNSSARSEIVEGSNANRDERGDESRSSDRDDSSSSEEEDVNNEYVNFASDWRRVVRRRNPGMLNINERINRRNLLPPRLAASVDVLEALENVDIRNLIEVMMVVGGDDQSRINSSSDGEPQSNPNRDSQAASSPRRYPHVLLLQPSLQASALVIPSPSQYGTRTSPRISNPHFVPRLTYFIEEPNKGKGFIKELCFSSDGRIICSPYDFGIRLLAFDEKCSELSHCVQRQPQKLHVLSNYPCHSNSVVSTKFSPNDCLLVSGCLDGKLAWHLPVL